MTEPIADEHPIDDEDDGDELEAELEQDDAETVPDDATMRVMQLDSVIEGMGHLLATLRCNPGEEAYGYKIGDWPEGTQTLFWRALTATLRNYSETIEGFTDVRSTSE